MVTASLAVGQLSSTMQAVRASLGDEPVTAAEVIERILARHRHDYARGRSADFEVRWPRSARRAVVDEWLVEVHGLLRDPEHNLHGRTVILGLGVVDRRTGRALLESGLFGAIAEERERPFLDVLAGEAVDRLAESPLAAGAAGMFGLEVPSAAGAAAVAFHPRGRRIAVAAGDGTVQVLDVAGGLEVERIEHGGAIAALAYDRHGRRLAIGGAEAAVHEDGAEPVPLPLTGPVAALAFSPDGNRLATAGEDGVAIWHVPGWASPMSTLPDRARAVAFSPDGRVLATAADGVVRIWDVDSLTPLAEQSHLGLQDVAILSDSRTVASVGTDSALRLWRLPELEPVAEVSYGPEELYLVTPTPDGARLAIAVEDGTVRIVDARSLVPLARLPSDGGTRPDAALSFSPNGRLLATAGGDTRIWDVGLRRTADVRLSRYAADAARGDDLLGIDDDIEAFAQLVAAKTVAPPLSIGVFGDWGSGKSFFMRQLASRVAAISAEARDSGELQRDISFYKSIVQIEFNAWHYAEGDLWASLVDHILVNLRVHRDEPDDVVRRRQVAIIEQLGFEHDALSRAERAAEEAHARLDEIEDDLRHTAAAEIVVRRRLAEVEASDPETVVPPEEVRAAMAQALARVGLSSVGEAVRELDAAAEAAQNVLRRGAVLAPLLRAEDRDRRLRNLVLVGLIVPAAVGAAAVASVFFDDAVATLTAVAGGVAGVVTTGARWVRNQADWTAKRLDAIDEARRRLDEPLRQERERLERKRIRLEQLLRRRSEQVRTAEVAREAQLARVKAVEAELAAATPARLLAGFLQDRLASGDYRKRLGTLALVRRDFETIAEYLQLETDKLRSYESLDEEAQDADVRINRIVLYIDDLDRCEPAKVVQVLQAVHLLLAFRLFVVVVGVDVRWVARSLALEYPHLLAAAGGAAAAPVDYLEKIFQIPFWLERPDESSSRRMLRGLLPGAVPRSPRPTDPGDAGPQDGGAPPPEPGQDGGAVDAPARQAAPARELPDLAPPQLDVTPAELEAMESLATLLDRSPRALKRFVNTYQLIKAGVPDPAPFIADGSAEVVLALLALETTASRAAEAVFAAVASNRTADLRRAVELASKQRRGDEALDRLAGWLEDDARGGVAAHDPASLAEAAQRVMQFSFRSARA